VVGAQFQCLYEISVVSAPGENDDGDVRDAAQFLDDKESVLVRQSNLEDDDVGLVLQDLVSPASAVRAGISVVPGR